MLLALYRLLTDLGSPFIGFYMRRRLAVGREDAARFQERFGKPSRPRPEGRLVWCHAASVGEAMSLLLLMEKLHDVYPDLTLLLTTGTVAAARMMVPRLPSYVLHQYVPIDRAPYVARFLAHWKPCLAIWIESELWPNTLTALRKQSIPTVLLNARMSNSSFRAWHRVKGFARQLMASFSLCLAQTESDRGRFAALGAKPAKYLGNLKYASTPLPFDKQELAALKKQTLGHAVWVMASTHRGEEEMAIAAHRQMLATRPNLLTIIVPRHAARGEEIARLLGASGLCFAQRSKGEVPLPDTQVYLADSMGELGLFYSLSPIVVLGGSFVRVGGHNPIEPAQLGTAIIFGPHMYNFSEIAREFTFSQAAIQIQNANEIAFTVNRLLTQPENRLRRVQAARLLADQKRHVLDQIIAEFDPWLRTPQ